MGVKMKELSVKMQEPVDTRRMVRSPAGFSLISRSTPRIMPHVTAPITHCAGGERGKIRKRR